MCGIYMITNKVNGKVYVGQSVDIKRRWKDHRCDPFNQNSSAYNYPLYRSIRNHGIENFLFDVLEECAPSELNEKEIFYISVYHSYGLCGYNQTEGGNQTLTQTKLSYEIVDQIITRLKESNDNSEIIGRDFGISSWLVRSINRGESWAIDGEQYPIRRHLSTIKHEQKNANGKNSQSPQNHCKHRGAIIHTNDKFCSKYARISTRKTERPEPLELARMIKEIGFRNVGKQFGVSDKAVVKWCKAYGIPHKLNDLIAWYNEQVGIIEPPKPAKKKLEDYMKAVKQIDPSTHEVVKTFKSISEAARAVGCANSPSRISKACKEGRKAAGYLWEFA